MRLRKDAKVDLIAKVPLFAGLGKQQLAQVASIADEIDLPEGKALTREGERGHVAPQERAVVAGTKQLPDRRPGRGGKDEDGHDAGDRQARQIASVGRTVKAERETERRGIAVTPATIPMRCPTTCPTCARRCVQ